VGALIVAACSRSTLLDLQGREIGGGGSPAGGTGGIGAFGGFGGFGGDGGDGGEGGGVLPDCTDPDATYIYLVTSSLGLYAYKPAISQLEYRGQLDCATTSSPFSMAVDRQGSAYVVYGDGRLWEVDVTDGSCLSTPFVPYQQGFLQFGMGYALDDDLMGETLYVSDIDYDNDLSKGLAIIDLSSYQLNLIGSFNTNLGFRIELTGAQTQLYAFIIDSMVGGGHLAKVDKHTGAISDVVLVPLGTDIGSWHFAMWGGDFYFFTEQGGAGTTTIHIYDPISQQLAVAGSVPEAVVGAGASTCAPQ